MAINFDSGFMGNDTEAWHHKGNTIPGMATADEALVLAGQNWQVYKRPSYNLTRYGNYEQVPDTFFTVREDNGQILGTVGERYTVIQNKSLYEFLSPVVDAKDAVYDTAGVLNGSRLVWALAKLNSQMVIGKTDVVQTYLLTASSHDGSMTFIAKLTNIRVVCQNTLKAAIKGYGSEIPISHSIGAASKLAIAHQLMGFATQYNPELEEVYNKLARKPMSISGMRDFTTLLFPSNNKDEDRKIRQDTLDKREYIMRAFESSTNNLEPDISLSAWSAYNAVTQYVDYGKATRGTDRLAWSWFGQGEALRDKAFELLVKE